MRVPLTWLREYVPGATGTIEELEELLSVSGTKVEAIHAFGVPDADNGNASGFRVGQVVSFEQHPNADRLRLCRVDVGDDEPRQIICGASNFEQGDRVAVVLPGATMPGGFEITTAKLRGVESHGMMLSERELELSTDHAGIMILPAEWRVGDPLSTHVPLGDTVIELEITPNRPDCLGVYGVAREIAAVLDIDLADALSDDATATAPGVVGDHVSVTIEAPELCSRYLARAFVDVVVGPSPHWMRARLAAAGMRSINNVVDVTNYAMLVTGQPLHAFDADQIGGSQIVVRRATAGETVTTLDGVERTLEPWMLSIADAGKTAVIAGVMGAADVEVTSATSRIVLEAACFDGPTIQRTSMRLGLRSESSSRFEKGLDPHLPMTAMRLASRLLVDHCGARMVDGTVDVTGPSGIAAPPTIALPASLARDVLGLEIEPARIERILVALGYQLTATDGGWDVVVPHWRMFDTTRAIDLVEEIGRINGLDLIPATMPARGDAVGVLSAVQRVQRTLEDAAVGLGLHETYTYALVPEGSAVELGCGEPVVVANPMGSEQGELRATLLAGHLDVIRRNRSAGTHDVALFEVGRTFAPLTPEHRAPDGLPRFADERRVLAVCCAGNLHGQLLGDGAIPADFHGVAGIIESLVAAAGARMELRALDDDRRRSSMHPGQAASVEVGGRSIGWIATVHPSLVRAREVRGVVVAAEIDLDLLVAELPDVVRYHAISSFPPVVQDVAFILPQSVPAGDLVATIRSAGSDLLERVDVFDRYVGDPIPADQYSLALRLTFRALDRTLTDDEIVGIRNAITAAVTDAHDGQLRDA